MDPETDSQSPVRRRQQRKACDTCRRRKVRCDIQNCPDSSSCSGCKRAGIECLSTTQWAQPRRRPRRDRDRDRGRESRPGFDEETQLSSDGHSHGHTDTAYTQSQTQAASDPEPSHVYGPTPVAAYQISPRDGISSLLAAAQTSPQTNNDTPTTRSDGVPRDSEAILRREELARKGLADFFKRGIGADVWPVWEEPDSFRITYVGTSVSNLYYLVDLHQASTHPPSERPVDDDDDDDNNHAANDAAVVHNPATSGSGGPGVGPAPSGLRVDEANRKVLHYPYPPIRPNRPWKPDPDNWCFSSAHDLAADVSSFPEPPVRHALILAYFEHVHPTLPIVSMPEFLAMYNTRHSPPPLLLFQAVLMAGAHACDHPLVAEGRHTVKSILFRRASLLYHARHETNRIHLMQAAALFTWHVGDGDTISSGPWYWAGIATRIGCGMGTHRRSAALPAMERSQYKRCFWAAFVSEVMASLETGRPCAIRAEDIDQAPLTEDDMTDTPGGPPSMPPMRVGDSGLTITPNAMSASPDFLNRMVDLAYIGLDIMAASAPAQGRMLDFEDINGRLARWSLRSGISSASRDRGATSSHLRMHYNLMLLHLHRRFDSPESHSVRSAAASSIIAALESLSAIGCLCQCHFTAVSAVVAAGIELASQLRSATDAGAFLLFTHALDQLSRLLQCAMLLAKYWPNAEAAHSVFHELHQKYAAYAENDAGQGERADVPDNQPDWNLLLSGALASHLNNFSEDQGWMSMSAWPNLPP